MKDISPETLDLWRKQFEQAYFIESSPTLFNDEAERYRPVDDSKLSAQVTYKTNIRYIAWINSRAEFNCSKGVDDKKC